MDFYFKPQPNGFADGILRVSPDILPPGSVKIGSVEIDGKAYDNFDADALSVSLTETDEDVKVKDRLETVGYSRNVTQKHHNVLSTSVGIPYQGAPTEGFLVASASYPDPSLAVPLAKGNLGAGHIETQ